MKLELGDDWAQPELVPGTREMITPMLVGWSCPQGMGKARLQREKGGTPFRV